MSNATTRSAPRSTSISTSLRPTKPIPPVTTHRLGTAGNRSDAPMVGTGLEGRVGSRGSATAPHRPSRSLRLSEGTSRSDTQVGSVVGASGPCTVTGSRREPRGKSDAANLRPRLPEARRSAANSPPDNPRRPSGRVTTICTFDADAFELEVFFSSDNPRLRAHTTLPRIASRRETRERSFSRLRRWDSGIVSKRRRLVSVGRALDLGTTQRASPSPDDDLHAHTAFASPPRPSLSRAQRRGEPLGRARALSGIKTPVRVSSGRAERHSLGARTVATAVVEPSSEAARVEEVKLSSSVLPGTAPSNSNPDDGTFVAKGARDAT